MSCTVAHLPVDFSKTRKDIGIGTFRRGNELLPDASDRWISLSTVAAWVMGIIGALIAMFASGFAFWLAASVIELKSSIGVMNTTVAAQSTANATRLTSIEADIKDLRQNTATIRDRLTVIETREKSKP